MNFLSNPLVARALWLGPLLLAVICVSLVRAGVEQRAVSERGERVGARLVSLNVRERSEITHGTARLRYTPPGATAPVERSVELPLSFLKELEGREGETLMLRALPDGGPVVLDAHPRGQWVLTFAFAAMALVGAVGLSFLVAGWNRLLAREGDPATRLAVD